VLVIVLYTFALNTCYHVGLPTVSFRDDLADVARDFVVDI